MAIVNSDKSSLAKGKRETSPADAVSVRSKHGENEGLESDREDEVEPKWYMVLFKCLFGKKQNKNNQSKNWKALRNDRLAEERAKEEEDERLKLEKRDEQRRKLESENHDSDGAVENSSSKNLKKKKKEGRTLDDAEEDNEDSRAPAARILTKSIRGFVAKRKYKKRFMDAVKANEAYYGGVVKERVAKKEAISNRRAGIVAAKIFVRQYVVDLIDTSALYLVQKAAATTIQCNFRGALTRKKLAMKPAVRPKKAIITRFTPQTLRRVWARSEYIPKGGWPGRANIVVEYDFREYQERPPRGKTFGTKTPKVHTNVRDQDEMDTLVHNEYSWVGLPVMVEPDVIIKRNKGRRKQDIMLLEGTSPFVGPQFVPPVIPPAAAQKGVKAIKGLGWREDMIDKQEVVVGDGKRAYRIIDPYSSAALAADLATIVKNEDFTFTKSPSKLDGNLRSSYGMRLGSALDDQSVATVSSLASQTSYSTAVSRVTEKVGERKKVGIGVWDGEFSGHNVIQAGTKGNPGKNSTSLFTATKPQVVQLVTPTRGYAKPLSSHKAKALSQAGLMPEQLEENFELQMNRKLVDHSKTTIFEEHGKDRRLEKLRRKEIVKQKHLGKIKAHSDQKLMENSTNWEKSVKYKLIKGANEMADEMREELEAFDEDPWSRSKYKPEKVITGKSVVWKKKPAEYYKFKYQWLPQPMLKQAILNVYPDSRVPRHVQETLHEESSSLLPSSNKRKEGMNSPEKINSVRNARIAPSDKKHHIHHPS